MEKHQKEIADYLRREYGVSGMWMQYGGKHPKLNFLFNGQRLKIPVGNPGEPRAMKNIQTELKHLLGPPPAPETKATRTMEDMMSDLNAATATIAHPDSDADATPVKPTTKTWAVTMAAYTHNKGKSGVMVYLIFPKEAKYRLPNVMRIERLDDENWKISRGADYTFYDYGSKIKIAYVDHSVEPFGSTKAEAIETGNGEVLIYLAKDKRNPVGASGKYVAPAPAPLERLTPDPVQQQALSALASVTAVPNGAAATLEDEMRYIAKRVREIEAMCPYKFVRLETGKLLWRAPTIE